MTPRLFGRRMTRLREPFDGASVVWRARFGRSCIAAYILDHADHYSGKRYGWELQLEGYPGTYHECPTLTRAIAECERELRRIAAAVPV